MLIYNWFKPAVPTGNVTKQQPIRSSSLKNLNTKKDIPYKNQSTSTVMKNEVLSYLNPESIDSDMEDQVR